MAIFDGFPFTSKEERERKRRDFEKRVAPFGVEAQREKLKATLKELFPKLNQTDLLFVFYDAKDAYTNKETLDEGRAAARQRLRRHRWVDGRTETVMLRFIELENETASLDEYPVAKDVLDGLFDE